NAPHYAEIAPAQWDSPPSWGIWSIPEESLRLLPDVTGLDVVELGCGTAYVSSWIARRGARSVVGLDPTAAQLAKAQARQERAAAEAMEEGAALCSPLGRADAEHPPFAAASFDLAISEYGAAIWCDPHRWIPEAARLLRAGGRLIFLANSVLLTLCVPDEDDVAATDRLLRPQLARHRVDGPDDTVILLLITLVDTFRLLRHS